MPSKDKEQIQLLQGTLDLIVLRTLATMKSPNPDKKLWAPKHRSGEPWRPW
jgi:hypothetical protein